MRILAIIDVVEGASLDRAVHRRIMRPPRHRFTRRISYVRRPIDATDVAALGREIARAMRIAGRGSRSEFESAAPAFS